MLHIFRSLLLLAAVFCFNAYADTTVKFNQLPFELAQKIVKGNGQRKLAYFTDPHCSYCKKLEEELKDMDDVTLYRFLYPVLPGSARIVRDVLCAKDPNQAWDNWVQKNILPPSRDCATHTEKVLALGKRLHISATPTLVFSNGSIVPGYQSGSSLELMMFASDEGNSRPQD